MGKISVGPPYFDTVFVPLLTPLIFLMGIGPLARWKQAELPQLVKRLRWAFGAALVAALLTNWVRGHLGVVSTLGLMMAFWIVAALATDLADRLRPNGIVKTGLLHRARQIPRAMVGMMVAHLGIAVFIFGVTMVKSGEVERDVKMNVGDTTEVLGYTFTFRGVQALMGPNYRASQGTVEVTRGGDKVTTMHPEKRVFPVAGATMTEAAIDAGFTRDLYVSLGEPLPGSNAWIVRVYVKPFISWIWGGCLMMAFGGFLAATDRRYRAKVRQTQGAADVKAAA